MVVSAREVVELRVGEAVDGPGGKGGRRTVQRVLLLGVIKYLI
jgi:hypothetical protein